MQTYLAVSWDGETKYISAYTESDARQQATDAFDGNLKSFELVN
jgi:hypothetical protein